MLVLRANPVVHRRPRGHLGIAVAARDVACGLVTLSIGGIAGAQARAARGLGWIEIVAMPATSGVGRMVERSDVGRRGLGLLASGGCVPLVGRRVGDAAGVVCGAGRIPGRRGLARRFGDAGVPGRIGMVRLGCGRRGGGIVVAGLRGIRRLG
jgi:hypothetical protein